MNIVYLCHRIPFPPDKGDKIRSYHEVAWLADRHDVHLFTLIDDPADEVHVEPLSRRVRTLEVARIRSGRKRIASLAGLLRGRSLSEEYFRDARLVRALRSFAAHERPDVVLAFSSAMAPYADGLDAPLCVDLVDVDSAKWDAYARDALPPARWVFAREARAVRALERRIATRAAATFVCTRREREDLVAFCSPRRAVTIENGVDSEYFQPRVDPGERDPYVVFTGAMDYRANVDAVLWYAEAIHPRVRKQGPSLGLKIVGSNPDPAVRRLHGSNSIEVTGRVPDVRPYLCRARVSVAPLRVARGVQNKVLEALSCGTPVVATRAALSGIEDPRGVVCQDDPDAFADSVVALAEDAARRAELAREGRAYIVERYRWDRSMRLLEAELLRAASSRTSRRSDEHSGSAPTGRGDGSTP